MNAFYIPDETTSMPPVRNYYFSGRRAYYLLETMGQVERWIEEGTCREGTGEECLRLISRLRWDTDITDTTLWPHLTRRGQELTTPEWFNLYGSIENGVARSPTSVAMLYEVQEEEDADDEDGVSFYSVSETASITVSDGFGLSDDEDDEEEHVEGTAHNPIDLTYSDEEEWMVAEMENFDQNVWPEEFDIVTMTDYLNDLLD